MRKKPQKREKTRRCVQNKSDNATRTEGLGQLTAQTRLLHLGCGLLFGRTRSCGLLGLVGLGVAWERSLLLLGLFGLLRPGSLLGSGGLLLRGGTGLGLGAARAL